MTGTLKVDREMAWPRCQASLGGGVTCCHGRFRTIYAHVLEAFGKGFGMEALSRYIKPYDV